MGAWSCRSHGNDQVHDELFRAGRRGGKGFNDPGGLTESKLNDFLMSKYICPLEMTDEEFEVQRALGSLPVLHKPATFLGVVVWGLERGFQLQPLILNMASTVVWELIRDKKYLNSWKHPKARRKRLAKEIYFIKTVKEK